MGALEDLPPVDATDSELWDLLTDDNIEGLWVCADGTMLLIEDMTKSHLFNAIAYAERNIGQLRDSVDDVWMFALSCRGDMATYYGEGAAHDAEVKYQQALRSLQALKAERERRANLTGWDRV